MTHRVVCTINAAISLALAWAALSALLWLTSWAPGEVALEGGRLVAIGGAAAVALLSGLGALFGLFGLFVTPARHSSPRPYETQG